MNKSVRIVLLDQAESEYMMLNRLVGKQIKEGKENTNEMQLLRSIKQKFEFIRVNPFYGDNIPKRNIPKSFSVQNLWRVELSRYWRMLYTIKGDQIEVVCFILNIIDHDEYNKKFGYRKR